MDTIPITIRRLFQTVSLFILIVTCWLPTTLYAAAGDLDPTFGDGGILISSITSDNFIIYDSILQPDGKLLLVGQINLGSASTSNANTFITRLLEDGSFDPSFGNNGIVTTDIGTLLGRDPRSIDGAHDWAIDVELLEDGRFVVAVIEGNEHFPSSDNLIVVRYLADGTLDTDFDGDGVVVSNMGALIGGGRITLSFQSMEVMADGRIMVAGYVLIPNTPSSSKRSNDTAVLRYQADGTLDTSFNGDGIVVADISSLLGGEVGSDDRIYAMKLAEAGEIYVAGSTNALPGDGNAFLVMHYRADGTLETDFDGDGVVTTDLDPFSGESGALEYPRSLALTEDGRIIVVGYTSSYARFVVVRYLADGALDATFSNDGVIADDLSGFAIHYKDEKDSVATNVAVMDNGRIVVAGYIGLPGRGESITVRYQANGVLDPTFGSDGSVITIINPEEPADNHYAQSLIMMEDGRMVLAGSAFFDSGGKLVVTRHLGDAAPQYATHMALIIANSEQ